MWAILLGIGMFMFLVVIHELGHFLAAKKTWVKVMEFGVGIPPKAFRRRTDKGGTEYTINRIPLWWFVRLKGEDPHDPGTFHAADSFITANVWKKLIILFAGVAVNFFAAWLFFSIAFLKWVTPINIIPDNAFAGESTSYLMPTYSFLKQEGLLIGDVEEQTATIASLDEQGLASKAGIREDDIIVSLDDTPVSSTTLSAELWTKFGKTFSIEVLRWTESHTFQVTCPTNECVLGVAVAMSGEQEILPKQVTWLQAFVYGWKEIVAETKLTFGMLGRLGKNLFSFNKERVQTSVKKLSWPVGIVKVGEAIYTQSGVWMYLAFAGMISLALAIFNILPIPALDGGRALGVLIQEVAQLKPEKYFVIENYFNMFFFVVLMWLGIYIILLDLVRFWWVHIPGLG